MAGVSQSNEQLSTDEIEASNINSDKDKALRSPIQVSSGVSLSEEKVIWTIENFNFVRSQSKKLIKTEKIMIKAGSDIGLDTEWAAYLKVEDLKEEGSDVEIPWIGICLEVNTFPENVKEIMAQLEIKVRKNEDEYFYENNSDIQMWKEGNWKQFGKKSRGFLSSKIVKKEARLEEMPLINGSLVVELGIIMSAPKPKCEVDFTHSWKC